MIAPQDMLNTAREYANRGWAILPLHSADGGRCSCRDPHCTSIGKHPRTAHGVKDASKTPATVDQWFSTTANSNIGIATGAVSGFVAIDIDSRHGGHESLCQLEQEHGALPPCPTALTGGGGRHLLFAHPGLPVQNKLGIAPGIDVRGDGGYIVAPPSLHASGERYQWAESQHPYIELPPLPDWLETMLTQVKAAQLSTSSPTNERRIREGQRNAALAKLAGVMRRRGASKDTIAAALRQHNKECCDPPLGEAEVSRIACSVAGYAPSTRPCPPELPRALGPALGACESLEGLLTDIGTFIRRFVALSAAEITVVALWVAHSHVIEAADFTPYLDINSAMPQSGKTRLLETLRLLVRHPWYTCRTSAAALVRKLSSEFPTLLLDESDTAFRAEREYAEALRGILNSGFQRDGVASMCVRTGHDWTVEDFQTFSPKAIAGIGELPDTVRDRSIPIRMRRKLRDQTSERFRSRVVAPAATALRQRIEAWAREHLNTLRAAEPQLPEQLKDRQQDVVEPLLAIADMAGAEWPEKARRAVVELCTGEAAKDAAPQIQLLADIRDIFLQAGVDRLASDYLVQELTKDGTSSWSEWSRGYPLTQAQLAKLLRSFEIRPRTIRIGNTTAKGYLRDSFADAFQRYLPDTRPREASLASQPSQAAVVADARTGEAHKCDGQRAGKCALQ